MTTELGNLWEVKLGIFWFLGSEATGTFLTHFVHHRSTLGSVEYFIGLHLTYEMKSMYHEGLRTTEWHQDLPQVLKPDFAERLQ